MLKRAVIKISGEALSGNGEAFDDVVIDDIARQLKELAGVEISLVVGGGNFWRGRTGKSFLNRARSDQIGMLGTVMNGLYLSERFRTFGLKSMVMTPFQVGVFTWVFSKDAALDAMNRGEIVINAGGTGHPYFSTDTIAALRAAELEADCVFYAKNIDGVYTADPRKSPEAKKIRRITYQRIIEECLQAVDIAAMNISLEAGTDSFVFGLNETDSIIRACQSAAGEPTVSGTKISVSCEEEYYV
ncbi:MAG: UMP kinase [Clostridiales bacterium]|jgi:uridylate kinase|nr:UMP kinase [Clostridiales bacterium]